MSLFSPFTLAPTTNHAGQTMTRGEGGGRIPERSKADKTLRSRHSLAALVNVVRNPLGAAGDAYESWCARDVEVKAAASRKQALDGKKRILYLRLQEATSYDVWKRAAEELDELEGNNDWKACFDSRDYDPELVAARLRQLDDARIGKDVGRMVFLIRTALQRDLGNMGNVELYKHSHVGTKDLIEKYIDSALETLDTLIRMSSGLPERGPLSHRSVLEQVISARQAFGRSALLLSGGGTFGMSHNGVLKSLWENRLLPRIISGASAGSIVSAIICTRTDEEVPSLLEEFCYGDHSVFEEDGREEGMLEKAARFLKYGHLYDISHLIRVMRDSLGDMTFQEAYNRTRRILNICVSSAGLYDLPRLLNYVTAPNVLIWSAVAASCSVPLIFSPASLLAKDTRTGEHVPWDPSPQRWIDGSVDNDLPMTRLAEMFNVNHFIVSQVNPHVVPFLAKDEGLISASDDSGSAAAAFTAGPSWLHAVTHLAKGEALYRIRSMAEFGIFPNALTKAASILNQKYSGDITITPAVAYSDFTRILKNPTDEFMVKSALMGERATWPKLSRVRNHCAIELALDDAVQKLRTSVVFSSSQVDLRLDAYSQAKLAAKFKHHRHRREKSRDQARTPNGRPLARAHRSMSQNSEPDASLIMAAKEVRFSQRPGSSSSRNSGHSSHSMSSSASGKKARSIHLPTSGVDAFGSTPISSTRQTPSPNVSINEASPFRRSQHQARPQYPARYFNRSTGDLRTVGRPSDAGRENNPAASPNSAAIPGIPDISSSGAETSGLFTSDELDAGEESDVSDLSADPPGDTRFNQGDWNMQDDGQPSLFPYASQPSTPVIGQGSRPFSLMLTPASPPSLVKPTTSPQNGKTKGDKTRPSTPEMRYKQIYHGVKGVKAAGVTNLKASGVANRDKSKTSHRRASASGLDLVPLTREKSSQNHS